MLTVAMLALMQPAAPVPEDPQLACAPRLVLTRGGPPPPVFHAERIGPRDGRVMLSLHRCGQSDLRVERENSGGESTARELEWVPASHCPALGRWIESTTRLRLPRPMLREHVPAERPRDGTWFTLAAQTETGPGWPARLRISVLEAPGAAPDALSGWFRAGERVFQACRDQGHGGRGYAPARGPGS